MAQWSGCPTRCLRGDLLKSLSFVIVPSGCTSLPPFFLVFRHILNKQRFSDTCSYLLLLLNTSIPLHGASLCSCLPFLMLHVYCFQPQLSSEKSLTPKIHGMKESQRNFAHPLQCPLPPSWTSLLLLVPSSILHPPEPHVVAVLPHLQPRLLPPPHSTVTIPTSSAEKKHLCPATCWRSLTAWWFGGQGRGKTKHPVPHKYTQVMLYFSELMACSMSWGTAGAVNKTLSVLMVFFFSPVLLKQPAAVVQTHDSSMNCSNSFCLTYNYQLSL